MYISSQNKILVSHTNLFKGDINNISYEHHAMLKNPTQAEYIASKQVEYAYSEQASEEVQEQKIKDLEEKIQAMDVRKYVPPKEVDNEAESEMDKLRKAAREKHLQQQQAKKSNNNITPNKQGSIKRV